MRKRASVVIDVLSVIFLLGLVAAVAIPDTSNHRVRVRSEALVTVLGTVRAEIDGFFERQGRYPTISELAGAEARSARRAEPSDDEASAEPEGRAAVPYRLGIDVLPANPFGGGNMVGGMDSEVGATAWVYDEGSGEFRANDSSAHRAL